MNKIAIALVLGTLSLGACGQQQHVGSQSTRPRQRRHHRLAEAQAGATKKFAKLNPDNDGTLDAKELSGVLDEAGLKAADPDNDGTLDEKEYARVVEAKFKAANPDNDGTIDQKELDSPAGQELLKLIY